MDGEWEGQSPETEGLGRRSAARRDLVVWRWEWWGERCVRGGVTRYTDSNGTLLGCAP